MSIAIYREYIIGGCFASTIFLRRCTNIASQELLINEEIRDAEVRLIDENGNQQGIVTIDVALRMAEAADLDLVKIAPTAVPPDMEVKAKACQKFLGNGDKVKVTIRFKGRQIKHGDIGMDVMDAFYEMVKDAASVDKPAKQEGRNMIMILVPKAN